MFIGKNRKGPLWKKLPRQVFGVTIWKVLKRTNRKNRTQPHKMYLPKLLRSAYLKQSGDNRRDRSQINYL